MYGYSEQPNTALYGPMLVPVSSVNSSMIPTPGVETWMSAEATVVTLMNVLRSNALPPQVPASVGCLCSNSIEGNVAAVGPAVTCGSAGDAVPADAAKPAVAHEMAMTPDQALSAATTVGKR